MSVQRSYQGWGLSEVIEKTSKGIFWRPNIRVLGLCTVRLVNFILHTLYDIRTIHPLSFKKLSNMVGIEIIDKPSLVCVGNFDNVSIAEDR